MFLSRGLNTGLIVPSLVSIKPPELLYSSGFLFLMPELLFKNDQGCYFTIGEVNDEGHVTITAYNHKEGAEALYQDIHLSAEDIKTIQSWLNEQQYKWNSKKRAS